MLLHSLKRIKKRPSRIKMASPNQEKEKDKISLLAVRIVDHTHRDLLPN